MNIQPETKIALGLIAAFMLVIVANFFTYFHSAQTIESGKSVAKGLELLATLESLFEVLRLVEKRAELYAENGEIDMLRQFQMSASMAKAHMDYVKSISENNRHRLKQLTSLETRVAELIDRCSKLVAARQKSDAPISVEQSFRQEQQDLLDYIRGRILYMESEQRAEIGKHNKEYAAETKLLFQTYAVMGLSTVLFFFGLIATMIKYVGSERRVADAEREVARLALSHQRQLLFNTFAHDLKNPIVGNQLLIKALVDSDEPLCESHQAIVTDLEQGNEDALNMIRNIIEISKIGNNGESSALQVEAFDLGKLLQNCVSELKRLSDARKVAIKYDAPQMEILIDSNMVAVKHLAINLLENAIKFSDDNDIVTLKCPHNTESSIYISFSVHNQGPPISEEDKAKLFSTIGQGELGRRVPGGTGIGMYLCAQLIELLGGTLKCESNIESGTTFIAALPKTLVAKHRSAKAEK